LALFTGRLALQFVSQYEEGRAQGKLPLLGGGTITDETVLPQMGDEAIGLITALHYSQASATVHTRNHQAFEGRRGDRLLLLEIHLHQRAPGSSQAIKAVAARWRTGTRCWPRLRRVTSRSPRVAR